MKKILVFLILFALVIPAFADMQKSVAGKPTGDWWKNGGTKDTATLWGREVEGIVETSTSFIWVSPDGNNTNGSGSLLLPYATITKALASVTAARLKIMVLPGEYSEVDIVWPNTSGIELRGAFGGVTIVQTTKAATAVITIAPTSTSTWSAAISGIEIESDYTAGTCLSIANANMTAGKKINVYLDNVDLSTKAATDFSLVSTGTVAGAIRVYATGNYPTWEGIVTWTSFNTGDRLRVYNHRIIGTPTSAAAVVSEVSFIGCSLPTITPHSDTLISVVGCWHESDADPDVYTAYTSRYSE